MGLVRRIVLLGVVLAAWLATGLPAFAMEATLVADAHVNSALPGTNSGSISNLNVGAGYTALLQFDLSTLPAGTTAAQVSHAVLRLYCNRADTAGAVNVQLVDGAWGEYGVTYSTLPSLGGVAQTIQVGQAGTYVVVDVTALVQGWVSAPTTNNGLALTSGTAVVQFDSKENDLTGHAAELDVVLAAAGPAGAQGPVGPQGAMGAPGAQGPAGPAGATGAMGPAGPAGGPGGVGVNFQGAYSASVNYALDDIVTLQGSSYVSLVAENRGNVPGSGSMQWGLLAASGVGVPGATGPAGPMGQIGPAGPVGPQGVAGSQGVQGNAGPQGPQGATGPQGPPVAKYTGNYGATITYALNDVVSFGGSSYISLAAGNVGNTPSFSPVQWAVLVAQGATGPAGVAGPAGPAGMTGATGAMGATGPQGPPLSFLGGWLIGTNYGVGSAVSFGGSSYVALAMNVGRQPDLSPTFWGVLAQGGAAGTAGAVGATGPQGLAGAVGVNYRGMWDSSSGYQANDAVLFVGTTYLARSESSGKEPDLFPTIWAVLAQAGVAGPSGPAGVSASVSIGMVSTGAAGSQAVVTNSGTSSAAVLNFTIPQGAAGSGGSGGGGGGSVSGIPFISTFHSVTFNSLFYAVNSGTGTGTEMSAVLTWVPGGCTATRLSVFSQQSGTITVKLRQGGANSMADTSISCQVASGTGCTVAGNEPIAAGNFVDFSISGASGTPAGVWTALQCE